MSEPTMHASQVIEDAILRGLDDGQKAGVIGYYRPNRYVIASLARAIDEERQAAALEAIAFIPAAFSKHSEFCNASDAHELAMDEAEERFGIQEGGDGAR